ncbi:hypothetical protein REPUB_Repub17cG0019500 [Reevesia pubescens]
MRLCQSLRLCFRKTQSHEIPTSSSSDPSPRPYQPLPKTTEEQVNPPQQKPTLENPNPSFSKAPSSSQIGTILLEPYIDIDTIYDLVKELGRGQPNIVEFKVAYEDRQNLYLVMELGSGGGLCDRIIAKESYSKH